MLILLRSIFIYFYPHVFPLWTFPKLHASLPLEGRQTLLKVHIEKHRTWVYLKQNPSPKYRCQLRRLGYDANAVGRWCGSRLLAGHKRRYGSVDRARNFLLHAIASTGRAASTTQFSILTEVVSKRCRLHNEDTEPMGTLRKSCHPYVNPMTIQLWPRKEYLWRQHKFSLIFVWLKSVTHI